MKKLLFPISDKDYFATMGRIGYLLKDLSKDFLVEFWTLSKGVCEDIHKTLGNDHGNINVKLIEIKSLPVTYALRDDFTRIFVDYTNDISIPYTDLKMWKPTAFDDFWGWITGFSIPEVKKIAADMVFLPLMSHDDKPYEDDDVFYTSVLFTAKDAGIKVMGYQIYPVFNSNKLMPRLLDGLIVRKEYERDFYIKIGIDREKIKLLTDEKDIYSLSTIEDSYSNNLYNSQIEIRRDELGIAVFNHPRFRPQLREIFKAIKEARIPVVLSLVKRHFVIRELKEETIIERIFFKDIEKIGCRFYLVEVQSVVPIIMISDVAISPTFIGPLEFSSSYGKEALVYNPFYADMPDADGIAFINNPDDLVSALKKAYGKKQERTGMKDIVNSLLKR